MGSKKEKAGKVISILIAEDSPTQALQLQHALEKNGFAVTAARNGKEALSLMKKSRPVIVISDIIMPEMDGYELCHHIKKDPKLRDVPVILLTQLSDPQDIIKGLQAGANNFITKPYDESFLLSRIQYILINQEVRKKGVTETSINICFMGKTYNITSDRMQMIDLLLSTYEHAVMQNKELQKMQAKLRDLNERLEEKVKQRTQRIEHLNSVLRAIRFVNQLIVREKNPGRIIKEACDSFVGERGYHSAWIALIDESDALISFAEAGLGKESSRFIRQLQGGNMPRCGKKALQEPGIIAVEDPNSICTGGPLAPSHQGKGAMILRLEHEGKIYGLLSMTISRDRLGDEEEQSLFMEVAGDIAFALSGIKAEEARKQSEEELRHERDLMARIMATSPVSIIMMNREGQITFANPGAEEVIGLSPDEVTKLTYNSPEWRITDYDGKRFYEKQLPFRRVMDTGQSVFDVRHAIKWPDGKKVLLSINGAPFFDNAGQIEGVIFTIQDVTKQVKTSKAFVESEQHYRTLFEQSRDPIYLITRDGAFLDVNQAFLELFGYTREEIKSLNTKELYVNPNDWLRFKQKVEKEGFVKNIEIKFNKKDGTEMDCLLTTTLRKAGDVSILGYHGMVKDITERKKTEEKIKEYADNLETMVGERTAELNRALYDTEGARDRIDAMLKSIADGLIVTDMYNRVILMNRAAEDFLGIRLSEVIDRPIDFAIDDKTLRERIKNTLDKKQEGYQFDFELSEEKSEHPQIIRARTSMIKDKEDKHTGIITMMHDVTQEREMDRMKTEFISTAAHELRTPLTSIRGFSEILLRREDIKEKERQKFLTYISDQSVNLTAIIDDLLNISRIESGLGFSLSKVPFDIAKVIKGMMPHFQEQPSGHRFKVMLPKEPVEVKVDRDKIEQVLKNIFGNAIKYSPDGGTILITGEVVEGHYQISIEDQGIGMTSEEVERIFEKFYRADASNTAIPGTGLGMSIVKYLVEAHGGRVWVKSRKGMGTTVRFTLPLHEDTELNSAMKINKENK